MTESPASPTPAQRLAIALGTAEAHEQPPPSAEPDEEPHDAAGESGTPS